MNTSTSLKIRLVADFVCPWCFIGIRRLAKAAALVREQQPEFNYEISWLPFILNPNTPPEREAYLPALERKFGDRQRLESIFEQVRHAGRLHGIEFNFEHIAEQANTLQAHRLMYWAQQRGNADTLAERLFSAHFQKGESLCSVDSLANYAADAGYPAEEAKTYLYSDKDRQIVLETENSLRESGIRMVPTFILPDDQVIVGAEDPNMLAQAILKYIGN